MTLPASEPIELDLADIQGNILTAYGKLGFPKGRVLTFHVGDARAGRAFLQSVWPRVTTALRWPSERAGAPVGKVRVTRPAVTMNIGFTFRGLLALETPVRTLRGMPDEFIDGMAARSRVLGDDLAPNAHGNWDEVWRHETDAGPRVHILVTLNAQVDDSGAAVPELEATTQTLRDLCKASHGGVVLLGGHGPAGTQSDHQPLSALFEQADGGVVQPTPKEHFGFVDAISDPVFHGQLPDHAADARAVGGGKIDRNGVWSPLATGEFLLGYPDEAQEIAGAAMPLSFSRNGTFVAYRKLHQDIDAFESLLSQAAPRFGAVFGLADPAVARATLMAKMAGRWSDGTPLIGAPDHAAWRARVGSASPGAQSLNDFTYSADPEGTRCPLGAHIRRSNTRDMLDPLGPPKKGGPASSSLNNRRRILRRGLPYGAKGSADGEHGIVMMATCASLFRQFEFVQQQWLNYGLDFNAGNDTCPLVGVHGETAKFVIPAKPGSGHPPFILDRLPQFVSTRGGAYLFVPSLTALRMIADGLVDPT